MIKSASSLLSAILLITTSNAAEHIVSISPADSDSAILKKAASLVPSKRQLAYHKSEFNAFIHFGPNTFTGKEWGNGMEDPTVFNPPSVNTDQWCKLLKEAGATTVIITVKHHDGYCIYQSRYNKTFSVKQSAWKNGKGDVLRDLSESCRKFGLKLGVYLSPADLYQIESPAGLYGNLSKYRKSIIPTAPDSLLSNPLKQRQTDKTLPSFTVEADDYNRYFMNQLYELLTEYGPIHEVWFDGAHPKRKGGQKYIRTEWFKMIRQLAPEAVIFGGPDVRWCGNEHGGTRKAEWNALPVQDLKVSGFDRPQEEIGTDRKVLAKSYKVYNETFKSNYLYYIISEVDFSIRHGWFWRNETEQAVLSADHVFDIYERTVGGNSVMLMNVPPNKEGNFSARDIAVLKELGKRIRGTYGENLATGATSTAQGLFDDKLTTYWQPDSEKGSFIVTLPQARTINRVALQENIESVGQRVATHALDAWIDQQWKEVATGTTIGYKKFLRFDDVTTDKFRVRILKSRQNPTIASFTAHYYQQPAPAVTITQDNAGNVQLSTTKESRGFDILYTLDGSEPTSESAKFSTDIALPNGGTVKARSLRGNILGETTSKRIGIAKLGWKVTSLSSEHSSDWAGALAIDGDPNTFWHTSWAESTPHPHHITIKLPKQTTVTGITYLPRQDRRIADSMVETGFIEVSTDGKAWTSAGKFHFGNLLNDPSERTFEFAAPHSARLLRFTSISGAQGKPYAGAAEIGILSE